MKNTGRLKTFFTQTQQTNGTTNTSNVYINSSVSYSNEEVLQAIVQTDAVIIPEAKKSIRFIDPIADSDRIGTMPIYIESPPSTPVQSSGVPTVQTDTRELIPSAAGAAGVTVPTVSEETVEVLEEVVEEVREREGIDIVPFYEISEDSIPLTADPERTDSGVTVESSVSPGEEGIFGTSSLITFHVDIQSSEETVGLPLTKFEKPRVLAMINDEIKNGYPTKIVVVFKKLTSNRARVVRYSIFRKNVFLEKEFTKIIELATDQLRIPSKYETYIEMTEQNKKDIFMYVDSNIKPNNTYVYKIEVTWVATGDQPQTEEAPEFLNFNLPFNLVNIL